MNNQKVKGNLSPELVDEFSNLTEEALKETKLSQKDITRFRLSVETAMLKWMQELPKDSPCTFRARKRFGRTSVVVTCEGQKCDPREVTDDEFGELSDSSLFQTLGLTVGYNYENGINRISFMPPSAVDTQIKPVAISIVLSIGLALFLKHFFPDAAVAINDMAISPIFDAMMNLLKAIAGPMIFLAVVSGIYGIGDVSTLGVIGKKLIGRFTLMTFVCLFISLAILLPFVEVSTAGYGGTSGMFSTVLELVLQIIPTDIFSPFINGDMLQIIFIAILCGIVMLILGKGVSSLCRVVDQIYSVVQLLMEAIGKMIPLFVFVSLSGFVISNKASEMLTIFIPMAVIIICFVIFALLFYGLKISLKYKVGYFKLLKKLFPTFVIALTTASSSAAFSSNVETCEKKLGISANMTKFGIPLGQVIFMPTLGVEFLTISIIMAQKYSVGITPLWIATAVLVCGVLTIASPPIPGGGMSILTILFLQLNIPMEALALAISINLFSDYISTAADIMCLQEEMVICAGKTGYLDVETLRK